MWRRYYSINGRLKCDLSVESGEMGHGCQRRRVV